MSDLDPVLDQTGEKGTSNNVRGHKFGLGSVFDCLPGFFSARCFGWNTADDSTVFMPRRAVPASPGGECCRLGSASRSWRAPARCRSFARSDRLARSAALRTHARCARVSGSWRGSLALALKTADGCADRVDESDCCKHWP